MWVLIAFRKQKCAAGSSYRIIILSRKLWHVLYISTLPFCNWAVKGQKSLFLCLPVAVLHQQQHLGCALVRTWNNLLCQRTDTCHHTAFAQRGLQRILHCYFERYVSAGKYKKMQVRKNRGDWVYKFFNVSILRLKAGAVSPLSVCFYW